MRVGTLAMSLDGRLRPTRVPIVTVSAGVRVKGLAATPYVC